jgi:hypothetical protein
LAAARSSILFVVVLFLFNILGRVDLQVHIVYMGERHPELHPDLVRDEHHGMLAAVLGR